MEKRQKKTKKKKKIFKRSLMRNSRSSVVAQTVKNLSAMGETQVWSLGQEDSSGERNGNPLRYSCLEKPMDRGGWRATVRGVAELDMTDAMNLTSFSKLLQWLLWKWGKRTKAFIIIVCLKDMLCSGSITPVFRLKKAKENQPPLSGRQWWLSERRSRMSLSALHQHHTTTIPMVPEPTQTQELGEVIL